MAQSKNGSPSKSQGGRKQPQKQATQGEELLVTELQEIHNAEKQLSRVIPKLQKTVENEKVREALDTRLERGERLIQAIEASLEEMGASPGRKKNVAAEGLIADMQEHMQELEQGPALDAVLIAALQKTEHYCIAAWGTAKSFGRAMGQDSVVEAMETALEEGRQLDEQLTQIAEDEVNPMVVQGGMSDDEGRRQGRGARAGT